jgi:ubiquinone/menaquinone biosynthesis C-methylase UbiE
LAFDETTAKNYDRWYRTSEGMYADEKEKELLISCMRFKTGESVLEIGSGTGRNVQYFTYLGLDAKGIEPNPEMLKIAYMKSTLDKEQIIQGKGEALPFADGSYDDVVFMTTIEFIEDREKAIKEAFRVARSRVGIGFLNRCAATNYVLSKKKEGMYKNAKFFCGKELRKLVDSALAGNKYTCTTKYTIYPPVFAAHYIPFVDELLEPTNLPFGNFGVMVIKKN